MRLTPEQQAEIAQSRAQLARYGRPVAADAIRQILREPVRCNGVPQIIPVKFRGPDGAVGRRDVATHWMHWYPAKMFHRIPQAILNTLELKQCSTILDPFCGSGTVLLEGALNGHHTLGVDINPLAQLISRVKTTPLDPVQLRCHANWVLNQAMADRSFPAAEKILDYWFKPEVKTALHRLRRAIGGIPHAPYRDFFLVTLSSIVRRVSLADPSIAPPVRLNPARAKRANARYRRALANTESVSFDTVFSAFDTAVKDNIGRMEVLTRWQGFGSATVLSGQSEAARTGLPTGSVDLIITSPPYCGAQKYVRSLRLEMLWVGVPPEVIADVDRRTLGTERVSMLRVREKLSNAQRDANSLIHQIRRRNPIRAVMVADYIRYMNDFAAECRRVLRSGGNAFVTFGTSQITGIRVDMARFFRSAAQDKGLETVTTLVDQIPSRGLITIRHSTAGRIDDEKVVWLRG